MAAIFPIMSAINGQLNTFSKYYEGEVRNINNLPRIPNFIVVSADRAIDTSPNILDLPDKDIIIDLVTKINVGKDNDVTPIYLCTASNLKYAIIDKIPIVTSDYNYQVGFSIIVPKKLYSNETSVEEASRILKEMYISLLNLDKDMQYKADPAILYMYNSTKLKVTTYDLTMMLATICLIHINLKSWFVTDLGASLDPVYTVNGFTDNELAPKYKSSIRDLMIKYAKSIDTVSDGIASGLLLKDYLYQ